MPISIDPSSSVQWIEAPDGGDEYPSQVVIDFGRPGLCCAFEMRDLLHWIAYRLDTGFERAIINHRAAVLLRGIAEAFYRYVNDEADYIIEDLQDAGAEGDFEFDDPPVPHIDVRLLGLTDDMICVTETFAETLWSDQDPHPVLKHNAETTIDFVFPHSVVARFGVRGIRVAVLDLICWLAESADRSALALEADQDVWLDDLAAARIRESETWDRYWTERMRRRAEQLPPADDKVPGSEPPSVYEQDQMLKELAAMI